MKKDDREFFSLFFSASVIIIYSTTKPMVSFMIKIKKMNDKGSHDCTTGNIPKEIMSVREKKTERREYRSQEKQNCI